MGCTYTKNVRVVYLKFKFNRMSGISTGKSMQNTHSMEKEKLRALPLSGNHSGKQSRQL
jgi:hypothetical protein